MLSKDSARTTAWIAGCCLAAAIVAGAVSVELLRVERGELFLFPLPWDKPPSVHELLDAEASARAHFWPAIGVVLAVSAIVGFACRGGRLPELRLRWTLIAFFAVAAMADLAATLWFFHGKGIDFELHPGIRLFGYAYGRTIGPIAGKALQAAGILGLSAVSVRLGAAILVAATVLYGLAAVYNMVW